MTSIEKRTTDGTVRYDVRYRTPSHESRRNCSLARSTLSKTKIDNAKDTGAYMSTLLVPASRSERGLTGGSMRKLTSPPPPATDTRASCPAHPATLGNVQLAAVTHAEVQRWLTRLDLAPASVRKVHRVLSMVLAYAVKGRTARGERCRRGEPSSGSDGRETLPDSRAGCRAGRRMRERVPARRAVPRLYRLIRWVRWPRCASPGRLPRRRVLVAESVTPVAA